MHARKNAAFVWLCTQCLSVRCGLGNSHSRGAAEGTRPLSVATTLLGSAGLVPSSIALGLVDVVGLSGLPCSSPKTLVQHPLPSLGSAMSTNAVEHGQCWSWLGADAHNTNLRRETCSANLAPMHKLYRSTCNGEVAAAMLRAFTANQARSWRCRRRESHTSGWANQ